MKTFEISDDEAAAADAWLEEHAKTCKVWRPKTEGLFAGQVYHGAFGGAVSYTFTPTSLGTLCHIECACGEKALCNGDNF